MSPHSYFNVHHLTIVCALLFYSISTFLLLPIELYHVCRFFKARHSHIIAKRRPHMVVLAMILATSFYLVILAYSILSYLEYQFIFHDTIIIMLFYPIAMASWYIYISRLWLLFYSIKFNMETIKGKWERIIDPDNNTKLQWFHSHKQCLGTSHSATLYVTVSSALVLILVLVFFLYIDDNEIHQSSEPLILAVNFLLQIITFYVPFLWVSIIWCKIPRHYDNFGISGEIKWTALWFLGIVVTSTASQILLLKHYREIEPDQYGLIVIAVLFLWRIAFFAVCLIQTRYPIAKFGGILNRYSTISAVKLGWNEMA